MRPFKRFLLNHPAIMSIVYIEPLVAVYNYAILPDTGWLALRL